MSDFDPYHRWLGIPPNEQPPTLYRLLGLSENEVDPAVIESAAKRQLNFVKAQARGPYRELANRVMDEILDARNALLSDDLEQPVDCDGRVTLDEILAPSQGSVVDEQFPSDSPSAWVDLEPPSNPDNPFAVADGGSLSGHEHDVFTAAGANAVIGSEQAFDTMTDSGAPVDFEEQIGNRKRKRRKSVDAPFDGPSGPVRRPPQRTGLSPQAIGFIALNVLLLVGFLLYMRSTKRDIRAERLAAEAAMRQNAAAKQVPSPKIDWRPSPISSHPVTPTPSPPARVAGTSPPGNDDPIIVVHGGDEGLEGPIERDDSSVIPAAAVGNQAPSDIQKQPEEKPKGPTHRAYVEKNREFVEISGQTMTLADFKEKCLYVNQNNYHSVEPAVGVLVEGRLGATVGGRQKLTLVRAGKTLPLELEFDPAAVLPKSKRYIKEGETVLAYGWMLDAPIPNSAGSPAPRDMPGPAHGKPSKRSFCIASAERSNYAAGVKRLQVTAEFQGYLGVVRDVRSWDAIVAVANSSKSPANDVEVEVVVTNGQGGPVVTRQLVEVGRIPPRSTVRKEINIENPLTGQAVVARIAGRPVRTIFVGD